MACRFSHALFRALLALLLLVVVVANVNGRVVLTNYERSDLGDNGTVPIDAPTLDYFQSNRNRGYYSMEGVLIPLTFQRPPAQCQPMLQRRTDNAIRSKLNRVTVVSVLDSAFEKSGCLSLAHMSHAIKAFEPNLTTRGYPSIGIILMMLQDPTDGNIAYLRGGPNSEQYAAGKVGVPDGEPAIPMAFTVPADTQRLQERIFSFSTTYTLASITYEAGAWNEHFNSLDYYAIIYIFMSINIMAVLYALYATARLAWAGQLKAERRNLIILLSVISAVLLIIYIPTDIGRQSGLALAQASTLLFNIAFYLLLYTWNWLFATMYPGPLVLPQRIVICVSGAVLSVCYLFQLINAVNNFPVTFNNAMFSVFAYLIPLTQLLNGLLFIYFTFVFLLTGHKHRANEKTYYALLRLSYIGAAGFIAIALLASSNVMIGSFVRMTTPSICYAEHMMSIVAYTLRSIALIYIFGVRLPSRRTGSDPSSGARTRLDSSRLTPMRRLAQRFGLSRNHQTQHAGDSSLGSSSFGTTAMSSKSYQQQPRLPMYAQRADNSTTKLVPSHQ